VLFGKYRLFLASNGTASVQHGRMTSADLYPYFEQAFVSQEIGHNKPSQAYFDACFARIPGFEKEKCLMVGDSLTSDILGGINAGIKTVWVNPEGKQAPEHIRPDYQIKSLAELPGLLEIM
jgi:2-haloacid dehalogenase